MYKLDHSLPSVCTILLTMDLICIFLLFFKMFDLTELLTFPILRSTYCFSIQAVKLAHMIDSICEMLIATDEIS